MARSPQKKSKKAVKEMIRRLKTRKGGKLNRGHISLDLGLKAIRLGGTARTYLVD